MRVRGSRVAPTAAQLRNRSDFGRQDATAVRMAMKDPRLAQGAGVAGIPKVRRSESRTARTPSFKAGSQATRSGASSGSSGAASSAWRRGSRRLALRAGGRRARRSRVVAGQGGTRALAPEPAVEQAPLEGTRGIEQKYHPPTPGLRPGRFVGEFGGCRRP